MQSNHYEGGKPAAEAMLKLTGGTGSYLVLHMHRACPTSADAPTASGTR